MRWRRILAVGLGLAMLSAAPAYANEPEAEALYQEMEAKSRELSDMKVHYTYRMDMTGGGIEMGTTMEMDMLADHLLEPEQMRMQMDATMQLGKVVDKSGGPGAVQEVDLSAVPLTYHYYYENGMYYIDMMGTKIMMEMPLADAMKSVRSNASFDTDLEYMRDLAVRTDGENRILSYTMDADRMNDLLERVMGDSGMQQLMQTSGSNVQYREIRGEYTVRPDGFYSNAKMTIVADMTAQEQAMTMTCEMDIDLIEPGQPVEITAPDLSGYTQIEQTAAGA